MVCPKLQSNIRCPARCPLDMSISANVDALGPTTWSPPGGVVCGRATLLLRRFGCERPVGRFRVPRPCLGEQKHRGLAKTTCLATHILCRDRRAFRDGASETFALERT